MHYRATILEVDDLWSQKENELLTKILDILIPANLEREIPAAGELGVVNFLADIAVEDAEFKAQIGTLLSQAQSRADEISPNLVRRLEKEEPEAFTALLTETYKGYYSRPDMRAKVGIGAHPVHPLGYAVDSENYEFMEELTAPVRARGPIYRDPS